jgi:hypothetical protein
MKAASLSPDRLVEAWLPGLAARLRFRFLREPLTPAERRRAEQLVAARYGAAPWTSARKNLQ